MNTKKNVISVSLATLSLGALIVWSGCSDGFLPSVSTMTADLSSGAVPPAPPTPMPPGAPPYVPEPPAPLPDFNKDEDYLNRLRISEAWYSNNFAGFKDMREVAKDNSGSIGDSDDGTMNGRRTLNKDVKFALSGGQSLQLTILPTERQAGKFRVQFHKRAPASPQKDGDSVREFYLQYALYWTKPALTWTHRDAQSGEAYKTLLLEGYGNGQIMPGMSRKVPVVRTSVNGANGCGRDVKTASGRSNYNFIQSALNDPSVTLNETSKFEDYVAKYGLSASVRQDSIWGYVSPVTDWSYKGRFETGGDWRKNLIDHPDRGHPYGGWGWPLLKKPAGYTPWAADGWTVVEIYVKQDPRILGYDANGKAIRNPQIFKIWAAPYGKRPHLVIDSEQGTCDLAYNESYYQWFELLLYDTNIVEGGGFGAKVDARTFTPTKTQFELIYEGLADNRSGNYPFTAIENPPDKTTGVDHEFMGNRIGWNTGALRDQLVTIVDSKYMGLVQDGVDKDGKPVLKHKTRMTVEPMASAPVGGTGNAAGFTTTGNYLQVQTWVEEGYRPPLAIYYDELITSYKPIPFPGYPSFALPEK